MRSGILLLDDHALWLAHKRAAMQPRCDDSINQLPVLSAIGAGTLVPVFQNGETYAVPAALLQAQALASVYVNRANIDTVANTTSETQFPTSLFNFTANQLNVLGMKIRMRATFVYSVTGAPTMRIRFYLGGVAVFDTAAPGTVNNGSAIVVNCNVEALVYSLGAGALLLIGDAQHDISGSNPSPYYQSSTSVVTAPINLAEIAEFAISAQWSAASPSNTVKLVSNTIELIVPPFGNVT